ncbi:MAG: nicotinate-nucleotide diphosphorylase (carboxylating), partial [Gammaproteobacteria bacterium]|nr:nicotinate-nucleotide diphosphorylase (carboxylating) [Gammaproteobacteria bacterium]
MTTPSTSEIINQVQQALNEDLGIDTNAVFTGHDVTANLIPELKESTAQLICRENAILCGSSWFDTAFNLLNSKIKVKWHFK